MKKDIYKEVTDKVIAAIESGDHGKWSKPWVGCSLNYNAVSGKAYQGVNQFLLMLSPFKATQWATFKQWKDKGYCVQKGSKGSLIAVPKPYKVEKEVNGVTEERTRIFFSKAIVFNAEQVADKEGNQPSVESVATISEAELVSAVTDYVSATGAEVTHTPESKAYYSPMGDFIHMPEITQFKTVPGYYGTLLHELTHWTGHKTRCDRDITNAFGSDGYAFEELVAELGATFLNARFGIEEEPREDHAAYLASWLKVLKNDNRAIFKASSLAQKAIDYMDLCQK